MNNVNFVAFHGGVYEVAGQFSRGGVPYSTLAPYDEKARKDCKGKATITAPAGLPRRITDPEQIRSLLFPDGMHEHKAAELRPAPRTK